MFAARAFIIRPEVEVADVSRLLDAATKRARADGLDVKTFRSRRIRMYEEAFERKVEFLDPDDAHGIYRALHQSDVLTLASTETYVRRDPRHDPPARRAASSLEAFVRYKAIFALIRSERELDAEIGRFAEWRASPPACTGIDDPRALPFHVFDASHEWPDLGEVAPDALFAKTYGPAHTRRDDGRKTWARANHLHGSYDVTIARCALPDGVHWDVSSDRQVLLCTPNAVWKVEGKKGDYANVYPNARIRTGCKQVWP